MKQAPHSKEVERLEKILKALESLVGNVPAPEVDELVKSIRLLSFVKEAMINRWRNV